ncbi:NHLP bacteriocin export ABC transporter permease/ATPase subunit [Methyloraptor flagellatus]|uniref:NHLP bacteriocin export ABC transporter permease/ATPase subunit n=1 Tax=Methyloraptor flagellatus TaxID=3162530 RepID=A0AAU7X5F0_9HYPH
MNVTQAITTSEPGLALDIGDVKTFDDSEVGYVVRSGVVEIYAVAMERGEPASGRHFLFEAAEGDLVPPIMVSRSNLALIAAATEPTALAEVRLDELRSMAAAPEGGQTVATQFDRWIQALSAKLAETLDAGTVDPRAEMPGAVMALGEGRAITARGGACWFQSTDADLRDAGGRPVPSHAGRQVMPLGPGLWLTAGRAGTVATLATRDALAKPDWSAALAAFHERAIDWIIEAIGGRDAGQRERAQTRDERTERNLGRTLGRFEGVLDQAPAWTGAAGQDERLLAPFVMVCDTIGIDLNQRSREKIRRATTVEEAARIARVRTRQIALRGDWFREDFGPFIGFLDDDRRPVAIRPAGPGRWRMVDPDHGKEVPVTRALADRLQPMGYMLYRALPAKPVGFGDVIALGWKANRSDLQTAVIASIAIGTLGLATPMAMQLAFDRFIPAHQKLQLGELAIGLVLAAVVSAAFRLAYDMAFLRVDGRMAAQTQAAMVDRVLRLPAAVLRFSSTDLAQRAMAVDSVRRTVVGFALGSLPALFSWVCNVALMAWYAPIATIVAVLAFLVLLAAAYAAAVRQLDATKRGEEILSDIGSLVFHLIRGIGVLRTSGAEARAFTRWGHDFAEMRARSYRSQRVSSLLETFFSGFDVLTMAAVFVVLGTLPVREFSTGSFMSFITAYGIFVGSSIQLARGVAALVGAKPAWDRAAPLLKNVPEGGATKRDPGVLSGAVELTNVAFRYSSETPMVFSGLSFKANAGEFVAVVGASGAGKSTFVRLMLGNLAPLAGTIQYDSMDLQHLDVQLVRRQIGVVLQNGKLMPGSIYENIMGSHVGTLDDAWEAARAAGIEAEIRALPMTMHTILTDAAAAFSGGQLQRMLLARALVGRPRLLILDEATSALDNVTQAAVTEALSRLSVTRIVIAHRLTTVRNADRICVIDGGRIVQTGTYDELIKAKGVFAELAGRQLT